MNFEIGSADVETLRNCPLCQSLNTHTVSRVFDQHGTDFLATVMCQQCHFVFRGSRPTKQWFSSAFQAREIFQRDRGIDAINPDIETDRYQRYLRLGKVLAKDAAFHDGKARILDIGCGPGTGLRAFSETGFEASGVEEDRTRANHGIKLGMRIASISWEEFEPEDQYDVITCLHSMEHFHEPANLLRRLKGWLKPNGRIIIEVPNFKYFVRDWADSLYLAHMANYTPATLGFLGRSCGLTVIERLRCYENKAKNDENLCLEFAVDVDSSPQTSKLCADEETPDWAWVAATYCMGLDQQPAPPYEFEVPAVNDVSLTYKNSSTISAVLQENLHMRSVSWDGTRNRFVVV